MDVWIPVPRRRSLAKIRWRHTEPPLSKPRRHADQQDQHRHLDQRSDHRGEGHRRRQAEGGDGDRDGELEIIGRRGEGDRRRARIVGADQPPPAAMIPICSAVSLVE